MESLGLSKEYINSFTSSNMSLQTTITSHPNHYSLSTKMDSAADKEERKREYNRLAQREFRRRRKEHLKNLEQAQKEQSSEQSEEIERLRYQNDELRRENEALRAQIFGPSPSSHGLLPTPLNMPTLSNDGRSYSLSPSISGASISGAGSPPASIGADMMGLSLTSSMLPPSMVAYTDPSALSGQPYSMVHPSNIRHSSRSSPELSGYGRPSMGSSFQSLNIPGPVPAPGSQALGPRRPNSQNSSMVMVPYNRNKARSEILDIFRPIVSDPTVTNSPDRHLAMLRSMSDALPASLRPTKAQLETPHYYGIDLIPSPALRDRLLTVTSDVARGFIIEIGILGGDREETGQLIIWGDDPLNETAWEFSQATLERWGWMLGRDWVQRSNFWRKTRSAPQLPDFE